MTSSGSGPRSRRKRVLALFGSLVLHPRFLLSLSLLLLSVVSVLMFLMVGFTDSMTSTVERNYGVVIDAGSSSSKVHLFHWPPHDGDPANLLTIKPLVDEFGDPHMKKVEPGIATFVKSPETAFTSLQPLLEFALAHIPPISHQHTSLYIFGTAGMRLLTKAEQDRIIETLYQKVSQEYPFYLPKDGIQVISGKLEGAFSWITVNYLLDRLTPEFQHKHEVTVSVTSESSGNNEPSSTKMNTVGCLDMGGASLQLAFEVPVSADISPDYTVDLDLGCGVRGALGSQHKHKIFVSTYLGYGTNEARTRYYQHLLKTHLANSNQSHSDSLTHLHSLRDPCAPLDSLENISISSHSLKIRGLGDFEGCKKALLPLVQNSSADRDAGMDVQTPCAESDLNCNLVQTFHRPPFSLKYEALDFYGTSEFWYTMRDVLRIGGHYTAYSFEKASIEYCHTSWRVLLDRFMKKLYFYADHYRLKSQCMKSAWLSLILHEGLGFPKDSISLHSVASLEGQSVQWALGALLYNTRYLPLREVQQHQLQSPPLHHHQEATRIISSLLHSSFFLPFLVVMFVALLLLCCRHRRRPYLASPPQEPPPLSDLHRSQSLNSLVKIHRRMSSINAGSAIHIAGLDTSTATDSRSMLMVGSGSPAGFPRDSSKTKFMV